MWIAEWVVRIVAAYLLVGAVFAIAFCVRGIARIDVVAKKSSIGFRVLMFPGATTLWPIMLSRWIRAERV